MPKYTELVNSLPSTVPFVGPETQERARGQGFAARLGANENVFGPSPKAIAAMSDAAADVWKYGDPENHDLKGALAAHHGVCAQNIVVGEGIDGLLGYLVRMVVGEGVKVVTSAGAYPTFNFHVAGYGGDIVTVPYIGDHEDPEALLAKAAEVQPALIYLANPDNPMGTIHSDATVQSMIDRVPDGTLLVLDEAYVEYAGPDVVPALDTSNPNVIRMRTFSKAYGMAGARIGYAIGHEGVIDAFNKIRNHFGVSRISQAGALAALEDQVYLNATTARIAKSRDKIAAIAARNGVSVVPSHTNFVAIDCGRDGDFAKRVLDGLIARNIFARMPFVAPQNRCIRISAGTDHDLDLFEAAFGAALTEAKEATNG